MPAATLTSDSAPAETWRWWEGRRLGYNLGLCIGGLIALAIYFIEMGLLMPGFMDGSLTVAAANILFLGILGGVYLMIANVAFLLGPISEMIVKPSQPEVYRRHMFGRGVLLSVAVPFLLPALALAGLIGAAG